MCVGGSKTVEKRWYGVKAQAGGWKMLANAQNWVENGLKWLVNAWKCAAGAVVDSYLT